MIKKVYSIVLFLLLIFISSCGNSFVTREMILNTSINNQSGVDDGENDGDNEITPEKPAPAYIDVSAAFKYILPSGKIDASCPPELKAQLEATFASSGKQTVDFFNDNTYKISVVETGNLTKSYFADGDVWSLNDSAKGEYTYFKSGEQFTIYAAVETKGVDVTYYQYRSLNPFFSAYGSYNTRAFEKTDGSQETLMKRFQFYRWSGFASGQGVSNYMIAIDTYTGLVFQFAEIDEWATILGIEAPSKYAPFENYDGRRNFYEYDPIGYVDADGSIITNEWYKEEVAKPFAESKETTPSFGKSPYYFEEGVTEAIPASIPEQGGYPVSGTLSVKAVSFKNIDVDKLKVEVPILGSITLDYPQYTYKIGAIAYNGSVESEEDIYILDESSIGKRLATGERIDFASHEKVFLFNNVEDMITLELSADIVRLQEGTLITAPEASVTSIDVPTSLIYNREELQWEDGNGFELKVGEKRNYPIKYSYADGNVELTYELSWASGISSSDAGNVIIPSMAVNQSIIDSQLEVLSATNSYTAVYIDKTVESASEEKDIMLDLQLYNLDETVAPITVSYVHASNNLIQNITLDDSFLVRRGGSFGKDSIPIKITLGAYPWEKQEATVTLSLVYPKIGYDSEFSPKEITLTLRRETLQ